MTDDGFFLVSASKDGKPMLRNGDTGDWVGTFEGHKGAVWGASINKDATYVGTAAADFTARVWDALTGDEIQAFQHSHIVRTCQFSGDQKRLATGGKDGMVRVWRLACDDGGDSEGLLALELSMGGDCAMSLAWITGCAGGSRAAGRQSGGADGGGIMLACGGDAGALTVFDVGSHLDR